MSIEDPRFTLVPLKMGSGWPSLHVAVDNWLSWDAKNPEAKGKIILTIDAENADEVCSHIDDLIAELEALKPIAKRKFARMRD